MTEQERAKEYLLDNLTENQIENELSKIAEKFKYESANAETISKLMNEIKSYMKILEYEEKIEYWEIRNEDYAIKINFKVYEDEFNLGYCIA